MLRRTITYTDYDGQERTEDFYFNLSQAEALEAEMSYDGGLDKMIKAIVAAKDQKRIIAVFKKMLLMAYGKKSDDGRRFIKGPEVSEEFSQTPVYSMLFMELAADAQKAADFVNAITPKQDVAIKAVPTAAPNISVVPSQK